jgi:thioredoxin reductase (NADPH)
MFYKDKTAAVIGAGNSALTAALYLAEVATKVYLVARGAELKGEVVWMDQVKNNPKIEVIFSTNVIGLTGENKLESIKLSQPYNGSDSLIVDGLFVEIGSAPDTAWLSNLGLKAEANGYLIVQSDQSTSQPGVWAAGDITNGSNGLHQVITACAEGAIAAGAIFKHLQQQK